MPSQPTVNETSRFILCRCAACEREMKIRPGWAGKKVRCPYCKQTTQTSPSCRAHERIPCSLPATCQPAFVRDAAEVRWDVTILDIAEGGVRLQLARRFEKGAGLAVELPGDSEQESTVVFVQVVHLKREPDGTWMLGCKFVSQLSEDEIQRLLSSKQLALASAAHVGHDDEVG